MFRRKEDGSDMDASDTPMNATPANSNAPAGPSPMAAHAPHAPSAPSAPAPATPMATAPAAQPAPAFRPVAPAAAMAAANRAPAPAPVSAPAPVAPAPAPAAERTPSAPIARPAQAKRVLTVGPEIQMKGEVTSCDRVIIEGTVDATMRDVHTVELAESGSLKGTAEVEDAEISGSFEGDLVVRGRLTVYASGRVRGNVTYGEIEIQRGGQISGNIRNVAEAKGQQSQPQQAPRKAA